MNEKFESAIDFRIEKATEKLNKYIEYLTLKKENGIKLHLYILNI